MKKIVLVVFMFFLFVPAQTVQSACPLGGAGCVPISQGGPEPIMKDYTYYPRPWCESFFQIQIRMHPVPERRTPFSKKNFAKKCPLLAAQRWGY